MELRQLEYFLAVVDHEGLTRAAERLYVSQPTLSQSMRALERELEVSLFHRTGRNLVPTPTGWMLVPLARQILDDVVVARDAMRRARTVEGGSVGIVCVPEMSGEAVASWSGAFIRRHPGVRLDIAEVSGLNEVVDAVSTGRSELGFCVDPGRRDDLEFVRLGTQRLLLVRPPGMPAQLDGDGRAPLSAVGDLPMVTRQVANRENDVVENAFAAGGLSLRVGATVPSRPAQLTFVLMSGLQAFLPLRMCLAALRAGAEVAETVPPIETTFGVLHRPRSLSPAGELLVADVGRELAKWFATIARHQGEGMSLVAAVRAAQDDAPGS